MDELCTALGVFSVVIVFALLIRKNTSQWENLEYGQPATDPDEPRKRLNGEL